jgi:serine/threonine protein kinase
MLQLAVRRRAHTRALNGGCEVRLASTRGWARGRFEILRELGAGGMGVVFEAFDREQNARVALKTLQRIDADSLRRFKKEFRSLQDVQHENLVRLGELFEEDGVWFFSMELVRGVDVFEHVCGARARPSPYDESKTTAVSQSMMKRELQVILAALSRPASERPFLFGGHAFDEGRLRDSMRQLAQALVALHRARKVHRDVKPSNLLVDGDGRLVVLDFGLIADSSDAREDGIVGTAGYMAPEQAMGEPVGPAADWYAVGAVLYLLLTGHPPFAGPIEAVLCAKLTTAPPRPSVRAPGVPPDLDALCAALLAIPPDDRPEPAEILRVLGVRETTSDPPLATGGEPSPDDVFVGRAREMHALRVRFDATRAGRASLLLLTGVSGVGKTMLVKRFLAGLAAAHPEALVIAGRCYERESVPYKAVDDAMDDLAARLAEWDDAEVARLVPREVALLARVFPVLRRVPAMARAIDAEPAADIADAAQMRVRVFAALRELLRALAERRKLVLSIDDLQWADADSVALLAEVLRAPDPPPLFLLATVRRSADGAGARAVAELSTRLSDAVQELEVPPLANDEARALIERLLTTEGADVTASPDAIAAEAGGHPMFISALVRHRGARDAAGRVHLDDVLWARASKLAPSVRAVLGAVALAGAPLRHDVASEVVGLSADELARVVGVLRGAQLVRTSGARAGDTIEPYHDRVRETVAARVEPEERRRWHRALAESLEARGTDAEVLANHWRAAGENARALVHYLGAGDHAAGVLAFERAARLYGVAIDLLPPGDGRARAVHEKRGDALANANRGREASEAYLAAIDDPRSLAGTDLRRRACEQLLRCGHVDEGTRRIRELVEDMGFPYPRTPARALLSLLLRRAQIVLRGIRFEERDPAAIPADALARVDVCWTATVGLGMSDLIRGGDFQTRHLLLALRAGDPYRIAKALAVEAGYLALGGLRGLRRTTRIVAAAKALAARTGHPHAIGLAMLFEGYRAFLIGKWADTRASMEAAQSHLREKCTGVAWELTNAQILYTWTLCYLGELDVLEQRLPEYLREARERGDLHAMASLRTGFPIVMWLVRDDVDGARRELEDALRASSSEAFHLPHFYALQGRTEVELYAGDVAAAQAHMDRDWPRYAGSLLERLPSLRPSALHARVRCALASALAAPPSERGPFLRIATECARRLDGGDVLWGKPTADLARAALASMRGDTETELARLRLARDGFASLEMAMHAAIADVRMGEAMGGEEGRARRAWGERWLAKKGVRKAERMVAAVAPGFVR